MLLWGSYILIEVQLLFGMFFKVLPREGIMNAERWIGIVLLALSAAVLAVSENRKRLMTWFKEHRSFEMVFLILLFFWNIVTCFLHHIQTERPVFLENDWWLFASAVVAFLLFPFAGMLRKEERKTVIDRLILIVIAVSTVFCVWVLWQYVHMNYVVFPSGNRLAKTADFRMAVGEANNTSTCMLALLDLCLYMVFTRKSFRKIPYLFGAAAAFPAMVLANSRTCWYAAVLAAALIGFCLTYRRMREKKRTVRILSGVALSVVCIFAMYILRGGVFTLFDRLESAASAKAAEAVTQNAVYRGGCEPVFLSAPKKTEGAQSGLVPIDSAATDTANKYDRPLSGDRYSGLNGRIDIYKASLFMMFTSRYRFLFGVTVEDSITAMQGLYGRRDIYHAQNIVLQTGVCFGVPAMLGMIVFLVSLTVRCFRVMFTQRPMPFRGFWIIPIILIELMAVDMMETYLNYSANIVCPVFYLFAGWLVELDREAHPSERTLPRLFRTRRKVTGKSTEGS